MTARQYARLSAPFRQPARRKALLAANRAATWGCYLAYPLLLLVLALQRDGRFFRSLLVPAVSFAALSLVRRALNFRRPYEVLDIDPIIHKDTKGKSMPSRHVFSIFVIAMTFLWIVPWLGVILLVLGGRRHGDIRFAHDGERFARRILPNGEQPVLPAPQNPVQRAGHIHPRGHIHLARGKARHRRVFIQPADFLFQRAARQPDELHGQFFPPLNAVAAGRIIQRAVQIGLPVRFDG